ncbi:MAG TPA: hypothetical protein VJ455_00845, partial [Ignavibacteria bacterium]|nr:hypothetical protein [Ignavibacteria bacterium]
MSKPISGLTEVVTLADDDIFVVVQDSSGDDVKIKKTNLIGQLASYKKYVALISQGGTDAPTAIILENTIGAIVWSYLGVGQYFATLAGAFTTDKTWMVINHDNRINQGVGAGVGLDKILFDGGDTNTFFIFTYDANGD